VGKAGLGRFPMTRREKPKPLRSLYFQFLRGTAFEDKLTAEHVAKILSDAGLIELLINKYDGFTVSHYFETEVMRSIPKEAFGSTIEGLIRASLRERSRE